MIYAQNIQTLIVRKMNMKGKTLVAMVFILLLTVSPVFASGTKDAEGDMSKTSSSDSMTTYYSMHNQQIKGYLALPEGDGPFPAIILIHEWWGLTDSIFAYADAFAREGYVALAVDLYNGTSTQDPNEARELASSVRNNLPQAFDNLSAAVMFLQQQDNVIKDKIASIGWCFGGGWAYQMALNNLGTKVSVMYYGNFNLEDDFQQMRSTILGHFAENDRGILVDDVRQLQVLLKDADDNHAIFIYPNMQHGFARDLFTEEASTDAEVDEASELAWERTLDFLNKFL